MKVWEWGIGAGYKGEDFPLFSLLPLLPHLPEPWLHSDWFVDFWDWQPLIG